LNNPTVLGHELNAGSRRLKTFHLVHGVAVEPDFPLAKLWIVGSRYCAQGRGLASPVAAQKGENFAPPHVQGHALDDVAFAVIGVDIPDRKEWAGGLDFGSMTACGDV